MIEVNGEAIVPADTPEHASTAVFEVRDVSRTDAPSKLVACAEQRDLSLQPGDRLPFTIPVPDPDPAASYSVRVHVDVTGNGDISAGDLLTTRAYPVLTHGAAAHVEVELRKA